MPFQGPSIFRRSCILDSFHRRCSQPPPLGPSPGTPLGLSAGGADLAEALRERNGGAVPHLGHGDSLRGRAIAAQGMLGRASELMLPCT